MSNPIHDGDGELARPRKHSLVDSSQGLRQDRAGAGDRVGAELAGRRCDFCGDLVQSVRRVALDIEYDRLQKVHHEQYSCAECFEAKEAQRLGMARR